VTQLLLCGELQHAEKQYPWKSNFPSASRMNAHLKKLFFFITGMAATMFMVPLTLYAETPIWAPEPLRQMIEEGLSNNQNLRSITYQINALTDQIVAAGVLPDPRLGIGILNLPTDTFRLDQEPMTQKQIFIAQKFPWAGKRSLLSEDAKWTAKQKEIMLDNQRLLLSENIADGYYDLGFISKSMEINARMTDLVNRMRNAAERRYAVGKGPQQDIFQAQVELGKLEDERILLKTQYRHLEDRINSLLNRQSYQPVVYRNDMEDPSIKLSLPDLESIAFAHNPELKIRESAVHQSKTRVLLAEKDFWPDIDIMGAYGQRDSSKTGEDRADFVSTTVSITLPVWQNDKQDKRLAAANAMYNSAVQSYENLKKNIRYQLDALATEIINLQDNYHVYRRSVLPYTADWARSALDAYEVGEVGFDTMINARIRLLMVELKAERYRMDIFKKRAALEVLIGQPLP
jgi:cobalt-zinc-cadmium efflux system outer membrane protein